MADLKAVREKLTSLVQEFATLWIKACEADGLDATSVTVEFADDNPYKSKLIELNKQIHLYEHGYRYLYMKNRRRGIELTGGSQ